MNAQRGGDGPHRLVLPISQELTETERSLVLYWPPDVKINNTTGKSGLGNNTIAAFSSITALWLDDRAEIRRPHSPIRRVCRSMTAKTGLGGVHVWLLGGS